MSKAKDYRSANLAKHCGNCVFHLWEEDKAVCQNPAFLAVEYDCTKQACAKDHIGIYVKNRCDYGEADNYPPMPNDCVAFFTCDPNDYDPNANVASCTGQFHGTDTETPVQELGNCQREVCVDFDSTQLSQLMGTQTDHSDTPRGGSCP